jgi:hypothetical protein
MLVPQCIGGWPFSPGEKAILRWLRSPCKDPVSGEWIVTGAFATTSGEIRELDFPWQNLPVLRLGWGIEFIETPIKDISWGPRQSFASTKCFWGEERNLEISSKMNLCWAADIPELKPYLPLNTADSCEQCITVASSHGLLVITIIECIRAFLIGHGQLAEGILEPNYLERILSSYELTSKYLKLEFSKDILAKYVSQTLIVCVAQMLCDSSFRKSWDQVYYNRRLDARSSHWNSSIPLTTQLPKLSRSWKVRLISIGRINLVLEIINVSPRKPLRFKTIEYTHPLFKKAFYEYRFRQRGVQISDDEPLILERTLQLSKNSQSENVIFSFCSDHKVRMTKKIMT